MNKIAFGRKSCGISVAIVAAVLAGVVGLGGVVLNNGEVSAADTSSTSSRRTTTSNKNNTTTKPNTSSNTSSTPVTTEPEQTPATTPDTGFFTGDEEFTTGDGIVLLTIVLAGILASYVVVRNRKNIFRRRVDFSR